MPILKAAQEIARTSYYQRPRLGSFLTWHREFTGGDTRPRRRPSARAWWPYPRQIDEGATYPTPRAWEKGRGPRSWWKSGQRWRPRARAVAAVCSNRSVMHISTFVVAFLRPIWSMGPSDLPGGPNTNVSSPLANQVHSMTLCAMQVVRGRRANGSGHGAVHGVALCSPTY